MPYDSHQPQGEHAGQNIFDYVMWSMARPMGNKDEVTTHRKRFVDLIEPLLYSGWLDGKECDELFWYSFHPEDRTMLLCRLHSKYPDQRSEEYFDLREVFRAARAIFSQKPEDLQEELKEALDQYPTPRGPYDYDRDTEYGPSISKYRAQELVQDLKADIMYRKELEEEDPEIEELIHRLRCLAPYEHDYAALYARCAHRFPDIADALPKPFYLKNAQPPSTFFTCQVPSPVSPPFRQSQSPITKAIPPSHPLASVGRRRRPPSRYSVAPSPSPSPPISSESDYANPLASLPIPGPAPASSQSPSPIRSSPTPRPSFLGSSLMPPPSSLESSPRLSPSFATLRPSPATLWTQILDTPPAPTPSFLDPLPLPFLRLDQVSRVLSYLADFLLEPAPSPTLVNTPLARCILTRCQTFHSPPGCSQS